MELTRRRPSRSRPSYRQGRLERRLSLKVFFFPSPRKKGDWPTIHLSRDPDPQDIPLDVDEWIAECQSLQPDRSLSFSTSGSSWDALCLVYLLSHLTHLYWLTEDITRVLAQKAYRGNYQGGWEEVQESLEQNLQSPEQFYDWFLRHHAPEEFFGNLRKRAKRLLKTMRSKRRDPHGPVVKRQRPRGYRDKGTYVPPHRPKVEPPESEPRVDRRKRVKHPLIYEEEEETETGGSQVPQ